MRGRHYCFWVPAKMFLRKKTTLRPETPPFPYLLFSQTIVENPDKKLLQINEENELIKIDIKPYK